MHMKQKILFGLLMFFAFSSIAQQRTITGKVTDEKGLPLTGVSISIKGTTTGTITNNEGAFSLNVPASSNTLVVTNIGYEPLEVDISNQTNINITLASADQVLTDVVVVGYG